MSHRSTRLLLSMLAILPLAACVETAVVGGVAAVGSTALQERGIKGAASDLGIRAQINDAWLKADQVYMRDLNLQVYDAAWQLVHDTGRRRRRRASNHRDLQLRRRCVKTRGSGSGRRGVDVLR